MKSCTVLSLIDRISAISEAVFPSALQRNTSFSRLDNLRFNHGTLCHSRFWQDYYAAFEQAKTFLRIAIFVLVQKLDLLIWQV